MPEKLDNVNDQEIVLATTEGDWINNIGVLLILAISGIWGSASNTPEDPTE